MRLFIVIMLVGMTTFIMMPTQEQLHAQQEHLAVVIVPVADLMGQPFGHQHNEKSYNSIALCGKKGSFACPRINQLLFHEIVTIIGHQHDEIQIKIPHMFFETAQSSTKIDSYWTLKKNVIPLSKLHDMGVDMQKLPHPISYHSPINQTDQTIAVLTQPHYDPLTRIHFSAGTRFVVDKPQRSPQFIMVWAYHPRKYTMHKIGLPVTSVTIINPQLTHDEQRKLMVQTARQWARTNKKGFIPYVWGGCSFSNVCTDPMISEQHGRDIFNAPITFYTRALYSSGPFSGFDCAGLIIRAAQAAGIPYFYKNTTTLEKYLKPITTINDLKTGDIIWLPGHVMMVADLKNNTLIEARGYGDGYGKVHEITLKSLFNHIHTYADLINAYNEKKSLERLNSKGGIANTVKNFKILSLESVWN